MSQPYHYIIRVEGVLPAHWRDCFDHLTATPDENGQTLLSGLIPDAAALRGLLNKLQDWGLPLVALERMDPHDENLT
ncbi:MAG: hypothetical protein HUU38_09170 [Anaerolineales bacterium]|nr:hypothetical protein [Anaerolineales bacterium]